MAKVQITHIKLNEIVTTISSIYYLELLLKKPPIIISNITIPNACHNVKIGADVHISGSNQFQRIMKSHLTNKLASA